MKKLLKSLKSLKSSFVIFLLLPAIAQAQDYSQVRKNSNVWVAQCKSCHPSHNELTLQTGIKTEQYFFNFIYEHKNAKDKKFGDILPGGEIQFVARFLVVSAYLNKLESDMRKAGDHLIKNIKL